MSDRQTKKKLTILSILHTATEPLSSTRIAHELHKSGHEMSERTIRLYLHQMDAAGWTLNKGKHGRLITPEGTSELRAAHLLPRMGMLSAKIDQMTYRMSFDLPTRAGTVLVNTTLIPAGELAKRIDMICEVFEKNYAMGTLSCLLPEGEIIGTAVVPPGQIAFCTVCSITLNGILLKHGIPTRPRFAGLIELHHGQAARFVEMISYSGTSMDPLELFIRSGITQCQRAVHTGEGVVGASFREIPADSRDLVISISEQLQRLGLSAIHVIGQPGQPVLGIAVNDDCVGVIVMSGLNPIAILEETGHRTQLHALSGLLEFNRLLHYRNLKPALESLQ